jgi:acyl carrier protein
MQELLALLEKELGPGLGLGPETPLVSTGIVDSLHFGWLLRELEAGFGVTIDPGEVGVDNFDTPAQMLAFVRGHR